MSYTTMSNVCHCGNISTEHNFRHVFEGKIQVEYEKDKIKLNANNYPEKVMTKCKFPSCSTVADLHPRSLEITDDTSRVLKHLYSPLEIKYREIKLSIPGDFLCGKCHISLEKHRGDMMTHRFQCDILIENHREEDKIKLICAFDDRVNITPNLLKEK